MNLYYCITFIFFYYSICVDAFNILFLSDIHLDIIYNSLSTNKLNLIDNCKNPANFNFTLNNFDYGRYRCNSPENLLRIILKEASIHSSLPDLVVLGGDFVAHFLLKRIFTKNNNSNINNNSSNNNNTLIQQEVFKNTLKYVINIIREYIPKYIQVLPVMGNNDFYEHYNVPSGDSRLEQISYIKKLFFNESFIFGNFSYSELEFNKSFDLGAFYSYDIYKEADFKLIFLNTNYFSINNKNENSETMAFIQLNWLEKQLKISGKKVIIIMHIPPYPYFKKKPNFMWKDKFSAKFEDIAYKYKDKIEMMFSGHYHLSKFNVLHRKDGSEVISGIVGADSSGIDIVNNLRMKDRSKNYLGIISLPSLTPIFENNPGYTYIILTNNKIENIIYNFLDLKQTLDSNEEFSIQSSNTTNTANNINTTIYYNLKNDFNFTNIDNKNIYDFHKRIEIQGKTYGNKTLFDKYISFTLGMKEESFDKAREIYLRNELYDSKNNFVGFICTQKVVFKIQYDYLCKENN